MSRAQHFLLPTKKDGAVAIDAVVFNGTSTIVNCGSDAGLDDLADNAFTVEAWVKISSSMVSSDKIIGKGWTTSGWDLNYNDVAGGRLYADVACATTNAESNTSIVLHDDTWHHITMFFDDAGDRKIYLAVDGVWTVSYNAQVAGVDAITSDAATDLFIGRRPSAGVEFFLGAMSFARISDNDRHTAGGASFTPPARADVITSDGNTLALWNFDEGSGTTLDNAEGTAARDGTISNGTWS